MSDRNNQSREPEADHSGAAKSRKKIVSGHLPGKWHHSNGHLLSVDKIAAIRLPEEGQTDGSLTLHYSDDKSVTLRGAEMKDFMDEFGLVANPKPAPEAVTEGGRVISQKDLASERDGISKHHTSPDHPHKANAVLTSAETDDDVRRREAGEPTNARPVVSPPTTGGENLTQTDKSKAPTPLPSGVVTPDEGESDEDGEDSEAEGEDDEETAEGEPKKAKKPKAKRKPKK